MNNFIIETSARHVHVTREALDILFGKGFELEVRKPLSQPGQYASNQKVEVVGPKASLKCSILGPVRPENQVELSFTDARTVGIVAPVRESGDVAGSAPCRIVGPCGEIELKEGVIIARRHVHMTPADAARFGVENGQVVSVRFETTQGGEEGYYTFEWEYASDGFLSYAVGSGSAYGTLFLDSEDGNLSLDDLAIECDYSDETLVNNPFAPDFVLGILAADNEQLRVAQVMGLTGTVSAMLPASIDGNAVTYVYDDEGYVTEAAYTDPYTSFETEIKYTYE